MTDRLPVDPDTMKLGLLLETAQAHQDLVDDSLKRLQAHAQGLDAVVRDEVRRALIAELGELVEQCTKATEALKALSGATQVRAVWCGAVLTAVPGILIALLLWWWLPTPAQIAGLRAERQQLSDTVARLAQSGGRIDLRSCGSPARLCVKVDRHAPSFGAQSDYLIVQGY
jgi:hypothetical protein